MCNKIYVAVRFFFDSSSPQKKIVLCSEFLTRSVCVCSVSLRIGS